MRILRTPEARFQAFAGDPLTPRYGQIDSDGDRAFATAA
jgi:hypothetical protein